MLLTKSIIMRWNRRNIKHYTSFGYKFTCDKGEFEGKPRTLVNLFMS